MFIYCRSPSLFHALKPFFLLGRCPSFLRIWSPLKFPPRTPAPLRNFRAFKSKYDISVSLILFSFFLSLVKFQFLGFGQGFSACNKTGANFVSLYTTVLLFPGSFVVSSRRGIPASSRWRFMQAQTPPLLQNPPLMFFDSLGRRAIGPCGFFFPRS